MCEKKKEWREKNGHENFMNYSLLVSSERTSSSLVSKIKSQSAITIIDRHLFLKDKWKQVFLCNS